MAKKDVTLVETNYLKSLNDKLEARQRNIDSLNRLVLFQGKQIRNLELSVLKLSMWFTRIIQTSKSFTKMCRVCNVCGGKSTSMKKLKSLDVCSECYNVLVGCYT